MPVPKLVYELLAQQIIDDYGIPSGRCLDIGSGLGGLGLEIARRTSLEVCLLDISGDRLREAALAVFEDSALSSRVSVVNARVESLPFIDSCFDLVVSRGSFGFWPDKPGGFREIRRITKTSGVAFIGGGASRYMSAQQLEEFSGWAKAAHHAAGPDWDRMYSPQLFERVLQKADIRNYRVITAAGTWVELRK